MDSKIAANYEEFEPLCKWQREEGRDTLVLHLQDFKKEQLKVQISNLRVLKISGERPLSATKKSRFYKEIKVGKEYNANDIRAKFVNGLLQVVMPKTTTAVPEKEEAPSADQQVQAEANKQPSTITRPDDTATKKHESAEEKTIPSPQQSYAPTPSYSNLGTKLALVITLASAIGVFIFYKYKTLYDGEFDQAFCKAFNICKT
ncbi:hypothetical protein ACET3Z_009237 [Daucus carota]